MAGGGLKMGQVIGETDARGEQRQGPRHTRRRTCWRRCTACWASTRPTTIPDHNGRPMYLLDERGTDRGAAVTSDGGGHHKGLRDEPGTVYKGMGMNIAAVAGASRRRTVCSNPRPPGRQRWRTGQAKAANKASPRPKMAPGGSGTGISGSGLLTLLDTLTACGIAAGFALRQRRGVPESALSWDRATAASLSPTRSSAWLLSSWR